MKSGLHIIGKILGTILIILADTIRTFAASILVMLFCIPYSAFMSFRYCYTHRRSNSQPDELTEEQNQINRSQARARLNHRLNKKKHPRLMSQEDVDEKFPLQSYKAAKLAEDVIVVETTEKVETTEMAEVAVQPTEIDDPEKSILAKQIDDSVDPLSQPSSSETLKSFEQGPDIESQCSELSASESSSSDSEDIDTVPLDIPDDTCAICIDSMNEEEIVRRLTCGHIFHAECVDPWLTTRRAYCPLCKFDYYIPKPEDEENQLHPPPPSASRRSAHRNVRHADIPHTNSATEMIRSFFGVEPVPLPPPRRHSPHEASDQLQQRHNYYRQEFNRRNSHPRNQVQTQSPQPQPILPHPPAVAAR